MKTYLYLVTFIVTVNCIAQNEYYANWVALSKNDISLLPEYGADDKTEQQVGIKSEKDVLRYYEGDRIEAGKKMVELGFIDLYEKGDFVSAMRRFNQAFLLHKDNADIYYGFGTIYFNLGAFKEARLQYDKGLKIDPNHSKILSDYGTTYLGDYYDAFPVNKYRALENLVMASNYLDRSLSADGQNSSTVYRLSVVNMYLGNCGRATSLLERAKAMRNKDVTQAYIQELKDKCTK